MTLTAAQLASREGKLTASRVGVLMNGDDQAVCDLWRECAGDTTWEPDDLSDVWPVQLGTVTEALNLRWYAFKTGREPTRQGEVVVSPERPWAAATLDGWDADYPDGAAAIECKHCGGYEPLDRVVARYMPQLHWQMYCTGAQHAVLSVIEGAKEPVLEEIPLDADYLAELLRRADEFWRCVETLTPPVAPPPVAPPRPAAMREVDMGRSNEWGHFAADWLGNRDAAKAFDTATRELKALTPDDASRAYGHGIVAKRSRNGAIRIGETSNG